MVSKLLRLNVAFFVGMLTLSDASHVDTTFDTYPVQNQETHTPLALGQVSSNAHCENAGQADVENLIDANQTDDYFGTIGQGENMDQDNCGQMGCGFPMPSGFVHCTRYLLPSQVFKRKEKMKKRQEEYEKKLEEWDEKYKQDPEAKVKLVVDNCPTNQQLIGGQCVCPVGLLDNPSPVPASQNPPATHYIFAFDSSESMKTNLQKQDRWTWVIGAFTDFLKTILTDANLFAKSLITGIGFSTTPVVYFQGVSPVQTLASKIQYVGGEAGDFTMASLLAAIIDQINGGQVVSQTLQVERFVIYIVTDDEHKQVILEDFVDPTTGFFTTRTKDIPVETEDQVGQLQGLQGQFDIEIRFLIMGDSPTDTFEDLQGKLANTQINKANTQNQSIEQLQSVIPPVYKHCVCEENYTLVGNDICIL